MYKIDSGIIKSDNGIPFLPRWFCDDRLAMKIDGFGISEVEYYNKKTEGSQKVFVADMWGGMKFYIEDNGKHYAQKLKDCEIMPFGFKGKWYVGETIFEYEQRVVNDTICINITPLSLEKTCFRFATEFYDAWRLQIQKTGDYRYVNHIDREWNEWENNAGTVTVNYLEGDAGTFVTVKGNKALIYQKREMGFIKHVLLSDELKIGETVMIAIAFDNDYNASLKRAEETIVNVNEFVKNQDDRYKAVMEKAPVLKSPYASLNNFFALVPIYHEACKVPSVSGAIRAKMDTYWVWGWDGMSSCFAYSYLGENEFVGQMLKMYMETADKEKGTIHCFGRDMGSKGIGALSSQGYYINLLYQYYMNNGDIKPYYEFAVWLFEKISETEKEGLGMFLGNSLFPDCPSTIRENMVSDLSAFNNSSLYCAICAMESLARVMKDQKTEAKAKKIRLLLRKNFSEILFDDKIGYFAASADADTLEKRNVQTSMSIKWDNLFARDLIEGKENRLLDFFEKNFVCEPGLYPIPVDGVGYDDDGNQLHCWWPATGEIYARLINLENRRDLIDKWIGWVSYWTDKLMCPEGIDCYNNTNEPETDCWTMINGSWQAYSMRAWYEAAVHSVVGIDFSEEGMNIYPYDGEEMSLENLHFADKTFDIFMKGKGKLVADVIINGKSVGPLYTINNESFEKYNKIEVFRTNKT